MCNFKVLIADAAIRPEGINMLETSATLTSLPAYVSETEVIDAAKDVDAILVRTTKISRPVVEASPRLKIVSRHGVGVDNVDVPACTEQGIVVTTTGDANSEAVSEHAFGCLIAVARKLAIADTIIKSGGWERDNIIGVELHRKVLGLIGVGRVGLRIAKHATGFDMEVIAYDPYAKPEIAQELNVSLVDLKTLLHRSDFISLHVPLTSATRHLIGHAELKLMKSSAILVNTARGGLIDGQALYQALRHHWIAGAALDVFEQEPLPPGHPLPQLRNLLCTPHAAGQTEEGLRRMSIRAADNILRLFRGEEPSDIVNPEALKRTE